jgi:GNAT superfamily N-acetyltransferase
LFFQSSDSDLKILRESSAFTSQLYDVFEHFQVDHYLHAYGLGVKSNYRGQGIAVELLSARVFLLKVLDLSVTFTTFSTLSSQKSAEKAGFKEVFSISYEELQKVFPHFDFSEASGSHCKSFVLEV